MIAFSQLLLTARALGNVTGETRLQSEADRSAFLHWFAFLAEAQFFASAAERAREIVDCSSLLRYAYREALRMHDSVWAGQARLPLIPALPSVTQYHFPRTPTGARLFRVGRESYAEFADAEMLYRYNVTFVSGDLLAGSQGDLLFYRQVSQPGGFHSMVVLGRSQITRTADNYVVYNTGPDGTHAGEIKRLSFEELLHFPEGQWRPVVRNPAFLGVFRWNIVT